MMQGSLAAILVASLMALSTTPVSDRAPSATTPPLGKTTPEAAPLIAPEGAASRLYEIGPGDSINVRVIGHPEFDSTAEITSRNTLILPILGVVDVRNLTVERLQSKLTDVIADGYLVAPQVLVEVLAYSNMRVWAFGYVNQPGEHRLRGPTRVLQMLDVIGNLRDGASEMLIIERRGTPTSDYDATASTVGDDSNGTDTQTIRVDLKALLRSGDLSQNVPLQNGDKLYVPPQSSKVYAFGEVKNPGFYEYREGMKVTDLIQTAGGFTEFANLKKIKIRHENEDKEVRVNIKDYYKNGSLDANVVLSDGDTVIVGSSLFF